MKNLLLFSGIVGVVGLVACEEHEVIPPPVPMVDLNCSCDASISDSTVSYTDTCTYESIKTIGTPGTSSAKYYSNIEEENDIFGMPGVQEGLRVEIGSIEWDDDGTNKPSITEWSNWFNANMTPVYAPQNTDPLDWIKITWTDKEGQVWKSDSSDVCFSAFQFNSFVQESDTTGDYMKFDATFSCTLWDPSMTMSKCLTSGHIKSAFRLD